MIVSPTGTRSPPSTARTVTSPCGRSRLTASTSTAFGFGTPTVTSTSIRPPRARTSAKNGRLEWRIASETARRAAVVASAPCTSTPIPNSSTYGLAMPVSYDGPGMLAPRWRVVVALFTVTSCIATAVSTFGVFLPVLSDAFGWSRGAVSAVLSISLMLGGVAAFPVGRIADRHGPRAVLATTVAIGAIGFMLSARISALWHLYLSYGVLVGIGMSSIYMLTAATVARWFETRRGLALAVVLSGFNLGWLTGGPLAAFIIEGWGWRVAYVVLGALVGAVGVPASLSVRYPRVLESRRTVAATPAATRRLALIDARLWRFVSAWCCLGLVYMMVTVHSVSYARDRGLPLEQASLALSAFGIGAVSGRLLAGVAADRFGAVPTMRVCLLIQCVALCALLLALPT